MLKIKVICSLATDPTKRLLLVCGTVGGRRRKEKDDIEVVKAGQCRGWMDGSDSMICDFFV